LSTSSSEPAAAAKYARITIGVMILIAVAVQPISTPVAHSLIQQQQHETATFIEWAHYLDEANAPDVLFTGDSRAREDIDVRLVSELASASSGRRLSIGTLGINAERPLFLEALTYRLLSRPSRPKLIVYQFSEYAFTTHYVFDPTGDFQQIANPFDPGYMALALKLDPNRGRLLRGWVLPVFANLPAIVAGLRCTVQPQDDSYGCGVVPTAPEPRRQYFARRFSEVLRDYEFSTEQATAVRESVRMARAKGVGVAFTVLPAQDLQAQYPQAYQRFLDGTRQLAQSLGIPLWDFHDQLQGQPGMYSDPNHLNPAGARTLAPLLAKEVARAFP
jgi:hypothetical protein